LCQLPGALRRDCHHEISRQENQAVVLFHAPGGTALGASRHCAIRQLLTESLPLVFLGGAQGLLLALWGVDFLLAMRPSNIPRLDQIGAPFVLDMRVLSFTLMISLLTGVIFSLALALGASKPNLNESLKEAAGNRQWPGGRGRTHRAPRCGSLLVVSATDFLTFAGVSLLLSAAALRYE
jgi:putative ABC transport system permease protein